MAPSRVLEDCTLSVTREIRRLLSFASAPLDTFSFLGAILIFPHFTPPTHCVCDLTIRRDEKGTWHYNCKTATDNLRIRRTVRMCPCPSEGRLVQAENIDCMAYRKQLQWQQHWIEGY